MIKVTSTKDISFPSLEWGINAGCERELPEDKTAQERILQEDGIKQVEIKSKSKEDNK